jgi:hypothetical protein
MTGNSANHARKIVDGAKNIWNGYSRIAEKAWKIRTGMSIDDHMEYFAKTNVKRKKRSTSALLVAGLVGILAMNGCSKESPSVLEQEIVLFGEYENRTLPMPHACNWEGSEVLGAGLAFANAGGSDVAYYWISCKDREGNVYINRVRANQEQVTSYWDGPRIDRKAEISTPSRRLSE